MTITSLTLYTPKPAGPAHTIQLQLARTRVGQRDEDIQRPLLSIPPNPIMFLPILQTCCAWRRECPFMNGIVFKTCLTSTKHIHFFVFVYLISGSCEFL